jgi:hypothetical protein
VFDVDKGRQTAGLLRLGDDLQADGRLAGGLGAEDLADAAAGNAADAQRGIEADGASRDYGNRYHCLFGAEPDNRPFTKLFFDLCKGKFYGFAAVIGDCHGGTPLALRACSPSRKGEKNLRRGKRFDGIVAGQDRLMIGKNGEEMTKC